MKNDFFFLNDWFNFDTLWYVIHFKNIETFLINKIMPKILRLNRFQKTIQ